MIDTIVIRIRNLKRYEVVVNTLVSSGKNAVTTVTTDDKEFSDHAQHKDVVKILYHKSGNFLTLNHRDKAFIPSSHYFLSYLVDYRKDYLEFNFSIPKYKYGTNLLQLINYYDQSVQQHWKELNKFLDEFFNSRLFPVRPDFYDVEINRIDFCFNQFFPSKRDALQYMEYQLKSLKTLKFKTTEQSFIRPDQTIMVYTRDYSFKIYHKGTEFMKNDFKELQKNNPFGYDLFRLQEIADRVLRYECTFRNRFMNYGFRRMYKADRNGVTKQCIYRILYKKFTIDKIEKKPLASKKFFLKSSFDVWKDAAEAEPKIWWLAYVDEREVTFDFNMFWYLHKFFWGYIKHFQLKGTISLIELETRLERLVEDEKLKAAVRGKKARTKNLSKLMFYATLSQNAPLKDLVRKGLLGRSQYYAIKKLFKSVGMSDYNPDFRTVHPPLDYQEYRMLFGNYH